MEFRGLGLFIRLMIYIYISCIPSRTLNYRKYGIFLMMGTACRISIINRRA